MNFIIYDKFNGKIIRIGTCPEGMEITQVKNSNEALLEGVANDSVSMVDINSKEIINIPKERIDAINKKKEERNQQRAINELIKSKMKEIAINELKKEGKL